MELTRRQFLKLLLAAGAAMPMARYAAGKELAKAVSKGGKLPRRVLGKTKVPVTILGLGGGYFARGREADVRAAVETALAGGVRYFDTAPNYGLCEERLGPLLAGVRDEIFLVTKLDHLDAKGAEADLRTSLKRLKTDHVDLVLQHGVGLSPGKKGAWSDVDMMLGKGGAVEFMRRAKREGLTKFIGVSIHPPHKWGLRLLDECKDFDVVMPFVNYVSRAKINAEKEIVERACRDRLGVVAMKVLANGFLADDYDRAFRYALSVPGVVCNVIGVKNAEEAKRAVRAAREFRPLTDVEMKETIELGKRMIHAGSVEITAFEHHFSRDFGNV